MKKPVLIACIAAALVIGGAALYIHHFIVNRDAYLAHMTIPLTRHQSRIIINASRTKMRKDPLAEIHRSISRAVRSGDFDLKDIEKLQFFQPGDENYAQSDPKLNVFAAEGAFRAQPPEDTVSWTLHRRVEGDGTLRDILYGVETGITPATCDEDGLEKVEQDSAVVLTPHSAGPVAEDGDFPYIVEKACVHDKVGNWYIFTNITGRMMPPGADTWEPLKNKEPKIQ